MSSKEAAATIGMAQAGGLSKSVRTLNKRLGDAKRNPFATWKTIAANPKLNTLGVNPGCRLYNVDTATFKAARDLTAAAKGVAAKLVAAALDRLLRPPQNTLHDVIDNIRLSPPSIAPCTVRAAISGAELDELGDNVEQLVDLGLPSQVPPGMDELLPADYAQKLVIVVIDPPAPDNPAAVDFRGATLLCPDVEQLLTTNDGRRDSFALAEALSWHVPFRMLNRDGESLDEDGDVVEAVGVLTYCMPANCCPVWPLLFRDEPDRGKSLTCFHATDEDDRVEHTVALLRLTTGERWAVDFHGDRFDRLGLSLLSRLPLGTGVPAGCTKISEHWAPTRPTIFYD